MIEVTKVTKIYGKKQNTFTALKNVSFYVPDASTIAIVGKSGSGKSTLMHLMSGLDHTTDGEITINGKSLARLKRRAMDRFRAQEVGFIFQAFFVEANQTVYQNTVLPLEIDEVPLSKRRQRAHEALRQVELLDKIHEYARNLSGGQKQRLAVARAIVNQPKLIFADEPTGNLDSVTGDKIINLLFNLNKTLGSTLCIVTHDVELAARCDGQITLKDGQIVSTQSKKGMKR